MFLQKNRFCAKTAVLVTLFLCSHAHAAGVALDDASNTPEGKSEKTKFTLMVSRESTKAGTRAELREFHADLTSKPKPYVMLDISAMGSLAKKSEDATRKALQNSISILETPKLHLALASNDMEIRPHPSVRDLALTFKGETERSPFSIERLPLYLGKGVTRLCVSSTTPVILIDLVTFLERVSLLKQLTDLTLTLRMEAVPNSEEMAKWIASTTLKNFTMRLKKRNGRPFPQRAIGGLGSSLIKTPLVKTSRIKVSLYSGGAKFPK